MLSREKAAKRLREIQAELQLMSEALKEGDRYASGDVERTSDDVGELASRLEE